jgi:hypothetical protein
MKTSMKVLIILSLVCLVSSAAAAQQKTRKKRSAPSAICTVEAVPKGMVIVAYKTNPACGQKMEIIVKRPATTEIVCADSPIPDGYVVDGLRGSLVCGDGNPLTSALSITGEPTFYGIRVGMTRDQVEEEFGSPGDVHRGTIFNPGKGTTWTYDHGKLKTTYVYFDEKFIVIGFEDKWPGSRPFDRHP